MPSISAESEALGQEWRPATLLDGTTAVRHPVELADGGDCLLLRQPGATPEPFTKSRLRRVSDGRDLTVLGRADHPDWRLVIDPPLPPEWLAGIRPAHAPDGRRLAIRGLALAGIAALAAGLWFGGGPILEAAAPLIPESATQAMGDAIVANLSAKGVCASAPAAAALEGLVTRLEPVEGAPSPVRLTIVDVPVPNALAAPGGRIVLTRGLIEGAEGADEVAGVLAHEMGHVHHLHSQKAVLRALGLAAFLSALGGQSADLAQEALSLSSSREAEREADGHALERLAAAGISATGLAAFFARQVEGGEADKGKKTPEALGKLMDNLGTWSRTHPPEAERLARIRAHVATEGATTPALSPGEWAALKAACKEAEPVATPAA